jgi:hypothetical protein
MKPTPASIVWAVLCFAIQFPWDDFAVSHHVPQAIGMGIAALLTIPAVVVCSLILRDYIRERLSHDERDT